ncbi:MAG: iron ABC transporter permease [Planctomycetota bacterium]
MWIALAAAIGMGVAGPLVKVVSSIGQPSDGVWTHLAETRLADYAAGTGTLVVLVCTGALAFGVPTAWLLSRYTFTFSRVLSWAMLLPLAMPGYIAAYAYTDLFAPGGPVQQAVRGTSIAQWALAIVPDMRTKAGAAVILASTLFPYVYFAGRVVFRELPAAAIESGRMLGCNAAVTLVRVELPLAAPALAAGLVLVLMETVADFGTADYCAVDTFATGVYRTWTSLGSETGASQLATVIMLPLGLCVWVESRLRHRRATADVATRIMGDRRVRLRGAQNVVATVACCVPLMLGFIAPVLYLMYLAMMDDVWSDLGSTVSATANTLGVAAVAGVVGVVLAGALAAAMRFAPGKLVRTLVTLSRFGYAIPGPVIAIGVISALTGIGGACKAIGLERPATWFFVGTIPVLVLGYQTRFLGVALAYVRAAMERIHPRTDDAARVLGAGSAKLLLGVHLPMMRQGLLVAFVLVFADITKELPITLMLRPFDFDTLAVSAYQLASDERLGEAAAACLTLIGFGVVPAAVLGAYLGRASAVSYRRARS